VKLYCFKNPLFGNIHKVCKQEHNVKGCKIVIENLTCPPLDHPETESQIN